MKTYRRVCRWCYFQSYSFYLHDIDYYNSSVFFPFRCTFHISVCTWLFMEVENFHSVLCMNISTSSMNSQLTANSLHVFYYLWLWCVHIYFMFIPCFFICIKSFTQKSQSWNSLNNLHGGNGSASKLLEKAKKKIFQKIRKSKVHEWNIISKTFKRSLRRELTLIWVANELWGWRHNHS